MLPQRHSKVPAKLVKLPTPLRNLQNKNSIIARQGLYVYVHIFFALKVQNGLAGSTKTSLHIYTAPPHVCNKYFFIYGRAGGGNIGKIEDHPLVGFEGSD